MISDLKDFERMLRICRKQGVTEISMNGIVAKLGELPSKGAEPDNAEIPTDELTPEQLMFYAVSGQ